MSNLALFHLNVAQMLWMGEYYIAMYHLKEPNCLIPKPFRPEYHNGFGILLACC
jgi:hypothetical protein